MKTVLLVEDEALIAMNEASMLERNGYEVITVYNAERAIDTAAEADVDLILMDIDLGEGKMDGTEAAEIILKDKEVPVVFLSSHTEPDIVEKTEGITSYGYIVKNSGETVLLASIKMAFRLFEAKMREKEKEQYLHGIFNGIGIAVFVIDVIDNRFLISNVNQGYFDMLELFGLDDYTGKYLDELYEVWPANIIDFAFEKYTQCVNTGRMIEYEEAGPDINGEKSYWFTRLTPIMNNDGTVIRLIGSTIDITDRKRSEDELQEREERFHIISNISSDYAYCHKLNEDGSLEPVWHIGSFDHITGYTPEELYKKGGWSSLLHPDDISGAQQYIEKLLSGEKASFTARIITKDGTIRWIQDTGQPWIDNTTGKVIGTYGSAVDITVRKELEEKYKSLFDNSPLPYQSLDENGYVIEVNPPWLQTLGGYKREEVIGKSFADFIHPDSVDGFKKNLEELKRVGKAQNNIYKLRKKNGNYLDVSFQGRAAYSPEGKFQRTHCVFEDITSRKEMEKAYVRSVHSFQLFCENANVGIAEVDRNNSIMYVNPHLCRMLGYTSDQLLSLTADDISHPDDMEWEKEKLLSHAEDSRQDSFDYEKRFIHKNGNLVYCRINSQVLRNEDGTIHSVMGIVIDITEQKKVEEEARKREIFYRNLMENSIDAVYLFNENGKVLDVNKRACTMLGYTKDELVEMTIDDIDVKYLYGVARDIRERRKIEQALKENETRLQRIVDKLPVPIVISTGEKEEMISYNSKFQELFGYTEQDVPDIASWWEKAYPNEEYRKKISADWDMRMKKAAETETEIEPITAHVTCKDGSVRYVSVRAFSFGEYHIIVFVDLSDINVLQKDLEKSLKGKHFLLQELNHRVKNNLLMVSSLIKLKDSSFGDAVDLSDLANQIDAIRIVHEKLFQKEDVTHINIKEYINDLLSSVFSLSREQIKTEIDVADKMIHTRKAVPLGLIINEIATNAVKYGFGGREKARFTISLREEEAGNDSPGQFVLTLSNTGNPFPEEIDFDNPETLGLRLISALAGQLDGRIELQREPNPMFTIRFPIEEEK